MNNLMEEARKGDAKAIAALMNRSTEPKGISVKASREGNCLQVLLEGESVPAKESTVSFIRQGMENLAIESIATVKVFGRQIGQDTPMWQEEIVFSDDAIPAMAMGVSDDFGSDEEDFLPDDDFDDGLEDDGLYDGAPDSLEDSDYFDEGDYGDAPSDVPHLPNESITDFVDDDPDLSDGDFTDETIVAAESEPEEKKSSSGFLLVGLTFLALLLGGYYVYMQRPELLASIPGISDLVPGLSPEPAADGSTDGIPTAEEVAPEGEAVAPNNVIDAATDAAADIAADAADATADAADATADAADAAASAVDAAADTTADVAAGAADVAADVAGDAVDAATGAADAAADAVGSALDTAPASDTAPAENPFRDAVNAATEAAELTQSAQTPADWQAVAALWETAIEGMGAVPADSPNYATAQDRLQSYPANLNYARQRASQ